ncbi:hypothetical protein SteCoe_395 [Stentor coeruleus]|uniref:Potassium channel domain-containing protein n=1 Tax=Stentor coeruleus TaxID=5963 RepID=A0A1R2D431_9CILI|nr:hypothetical protein SteCoe_395 [Stentor coeruleus]
MNIFQVIGNAQNSNASSETERINFLGQRISRSVLRINKSQNSIPFDSSAFEYRDFNTISIPEYYNRLRALSNENPLLVKDRGYVILKRNKKKHFFDVILSILMYYSVISSLYYLAFKDKNAIGAAFDIFVWIMFTVDIILNFLTEYTDKKFRSILNLKLIASNYAKTWLIFDLMAQIPLGWFGHPTAEYFLRLIRVLKMEKNFVLININAISNKLSGLFYKRDCRDKTQFKLKFRYACKIAKQMLKMLFLTYFLACLWYYYVDYIIRKRHTDNDFVKNFNLEEDSEYKKIIKTWYYIFTTLATVGYGDFYATNIYEMGFAILLLIAGPTWFAFMMGSAIQMINKLNDVNGIANKLTDLELWITGIEEKYEVIPINIKSKILIHFKNFWKNDRLASMLNLSQEGFLSLECRSYFYSEMPNRFKRNLIGYLFGDIIKDHKTFFVHFSKIKYELCRSMQPRFYAANSVILECGNQVFEIIFVNSGRYEIGLSTCKGFRSYFNKSQKSIIGDYFFLNSIQAFATYKAMTNIQSYSIPCFILAEFIKLFKINVSSYLKKISKYYKELFNLMKNAPQETEEEKKDDYEKKSFSSLSDKKYFSGFLKKRIINCLISEKDENSNLKDVFDYVNKVNGVIKKLNSSRKDMLADLKEQLLLILIKNSTENNF